MWAWALVLFHRPLYAAYRAAPSLVGGWDGRENHEICAVITGTKADLWLHAANEQECAQIINKHFDSRYVVALCALYFYCMYQFASIAWLWCTQKIRGDQTKQTIVYCYPPTKEWVDDHHDQVRPRHSYRLSATSRSSRRRRALRLRRRRSSSNSSNQKTSRSGT